MSAALTCGGCMLGEHNKHDPNWGIRPGLIGGWVCRCSGDCAERFAAMCERLVEELLPMPHIGVINPSDSGSSEQETA